MGQSHEPIRSYQHLQVKTDLGDKCIYLYNDLCHSLASAITNAINDQVVIDLPMKPSLQMKRNPCLLTRQFS